MKLIKPLELLKVQEIKLIILHCVAIYPPEDSQVNLNRILTLKIYTLTHLVFLITLLVPSITSIALGARVIEKHFTIDKKMDGWDQHISADENDMKQIVNGCKRVFDGLGSEKIAV